MSEERSIEESVTEPDYTEEELENIAGLCEVLMAIHKRLISEGYSIEELRKEVAKRKEKC